LQTLILEIEGHLNNWPITYLSTNLHEPTPLTPSYLLYGRMINTAPHATVEHDELTDEDYREDNNLHQSLSKKAKARALMIKHFWMQWKKEYLTSLRETLTNNNGSDH